MFDAQAWSVRDCIMERIDLPFAEVMIRLVIDRIETEDALADDYGAIEYQGAYTMELVAETDYPSFDVSASNKAFFEWKRHKKKGIMDFRNYSYTSPITGTEAPPHHTPWKDAMDDSLESYLEI